MKKIFIELNLWKKAIKRILTDARAALLFSFEKILIVFYVWYFDIKYLPGKIKRRIWNKHVLLWWYKLWIRKNEFHRSLDMDTGAMLEMNKQEMEKYRADLLRRREIAHKKDFAKY